MLASAKAGIGPVLPELIMATANFVTDLTEIATQIVEAVAGIANIYNSFRLLSVSRGYYDLYKQQKEFYYNTFQIGLETPLANEVYTIPLPVLDYAATVKLAYNADTGPFGGRSTDALGWWTRHGQTYSASVDPRLKLEFDVEVNRIMTDWTNYLFRFAETYYDLENDIRWKKRLSLHNIGIKTGTAVSSALNGALSNYQEHVADFSNQLATYGNGIARQAGYKQGMADTSDQFDRGGFNPRMNVPARSPTYINADVGVNYSYGERAA